MDWSTEPFVVIFAAVVGAVVGSFLNVVIYRVPREKSLVQPGSACPSCDAPIRWFDNVPILAWIALRGRCRRCQHPISIRYPLVEAAASALAVLAVVRWGLTLTAFEVVVFAWVSLALGLIDLDFQILPNSMTYPSIVFGLTCSYFGNETWSFAPFLNALVGAAVGALLPTLVIVIYKLWRGIEGMGWGDVKYLAAIGSVVGLRGCVGVLVVAATLGALVGVGLILAKRGSAKTALPFGTFLALAVLLWLYAPESWLAASPL